MREVARAISDGSNRATLAPGNKLLDARSGSRGPLLNRYFLLLTSLYARQFYQFV